MNSIEAAKHSHSSIARASEAPAMADETLSFRIAVADDAPALARLAMEATSGMTEYLYADVLPGMSAEDILARQFADPQHPLSYRSCLVADVAGRAVALVQTHAYDEEIPPPSVPIPPHRLVVFAPAEEMPAPGSYYIGSMAVAARWRGKGIATQLLRRALADASRGGHARASLHVFAQNRQAVRLYARNGFEVVDRRATVWRAPMQFTGDLLLMIATL